MPVSSKAVNRTSIMCMIIVLLYLIRLERKRGAGSPERNVGLPSVPGVYILLEGRLGSSM